MKWLVRDHCRVYRSHTKWLVVLVLLGLIGSCDWINVVAYVLVNLLTGLAGAAMSPTGFTQASFASAIPNAGAVLLGGATNAGWALVLYETLGRTLLEKWLKLKKPA
jgi:hypothetical protein